jgi:hypothetical protein
MARLLTEARFFLVLEGATKKTAAVLEQIEP